MHASVVHVHVLWKNAVCCNALVVFTRYFKIVIPPYERLSPKRLVFSRISVALIIQHFCFSNYNCICAMHVFSFFVIYYSSPKVSPSTRHPLSFVTDKHNISTSYCNVMEFFGSSTTVWIIPGNWEDMGNISRKSNTWSIERKNKLEWVSKLTNE